jgi:hypothetical protein
MSTQTLEAPQVAVSTNGIAAPSSLSIGASLYPQYPDPHRPPKDEYGVIEVRKPPSSALDGYWRAELRDQYGVEPSSIISTQDPFVVAFHLWLSGDLWRCICGDWCFDMCFESIGGGHEFCLSDLPNIEPQLSVRDWVGCRPHALHFWVVVTCPPGTVPGGKKNKLYRVGATFQMLDACKKPAAVVGYQGLGEYQFYNPN